MNYLIYKGNELVAQTDNKSYKNDYVKRLKSYGFKVKVDKHDSLPIQLLNSMDFQSLELIDLRPYISGIYTDEEIGNVSQYIEVDMNNLANSINALQLSMLYLKLTDIEKDIIHQMVELIDDMVMDVSGDEASPLMFDDYFNIEELVRDMHLQRIKPTFN